jgi:hypothetical protein
MSEDLPDGNKHGKGRLEVSFYYTKAPEPLPAALEGLKLARFLYLNGDRDTQSV